MTDEVPWRSHALRGGIALLAVLLFQQLARGETTLSIAIAVALGYVIVAELVRRRGSSSSGNL